MRSQLILLYSPTLVKHLADGAVPSLEFCLQGNQQWVLFDLDGAADGNTMRLQLSLCQGSTVRIISRVVDVETWISDRLIPLRLREQV